MARSAQSGITAARPASAGYIVAAWLPHREKEREESGAAAATAAPHQRIQHNFLKTKLSGIN